MSDTHIRVDRYTVEPTGERSNIFKVPYYRMIDSHTGDVVRDRMSREAALNAASYLNGRDMTPEQDRKENK